MTNAEIAAVLRRGQAEEQRKLADELDPPRPEPGTVVWWRYKEGTYWWLAEIAKDGKGLRWPSRTIPFEEIEWKPVRILAPDEVAVKVPPVSEWPPLSVGLALMYYPDNGHHEGYKRLITRAEAERMEAYNE